MQRFFLKLDRKLDLKTILVFLLILVVEIAIGFVVYFTGGTTYVYPYFMFFPVIVGGFTFGYQMGLLFGFIGGFILGPYMPLHVAYHVPQSTQNWLIRMGFLCLAGSLVGVLRNFMIDYYKKREEFLTIDPFNGLPNRNSFFQLINEELSHWDSYSVFLIEIKNQNDIVAAFGFDFFTSLVKYLNVELRNVLELEQPIYSVRLNLLGFGLHADLHLNAQKISDFFKKSLKVQDIPIFCDVALGISNYPSDGITSLELVQKALVALDEAKKKHKPFIILSNTDTRPIPVIHLISQIDSAIKSGDIDFYYQPIIGAQDHKPYSIEALVRWQHAQYGLISPAEYIDYLESTNLVNELTDRSIELNSQRILEFSKMGISVQMAINISPTNLLQENFVQNVMRIINLNGASPEMFTFEITERGLVTSYDEALQNINELHNLGIKISIDDFGAGNTSIDCFSKSKIDSIKIDQLFTKNIITDIITRKIVQGLILMSRSVDVKTIAEGVETKEIYETLVPLGVDYIQGYYFNKPMNYPDIRNWLQEYF
jgi:EAL domain-containing protein (putative c-di-GMP-specific phosphodiesterase class I)/GGDEF domain-containing protein